MPRSSSGDGQRVPGPDARSPFAQASGPGLIRILALYGPTGTGKSSVAVRVAEALDGEIVGCDALQVYRGLDAATAKPSRTERARVPHHLIDVADPRVDFHLGAYVRAAEEAIAGIARRGRVPIVVGGTGMYLRGLLRGVVEAPPRNDALRERLRGLVARGGAGRLRRILARRDPASAERIPAADAQRLVRALEIALDTGPSWSERLRREGSWAGTEERYDALKILLDTDREALGRRLDARVDRFFERGLVEEVRAILAAGVPPEANALKGIGYREVVAAIRDGRDPLEARERVKRNTRRYAKRQRTWFRSEPGSRSIDAGLEPDEIASAILEAWRIGARPG